MKFLDERTTATPGRRLRDLLQSGQLIMGGGAHDAISAWLQAAQAAGKAAPVPHATQPLQAYSGKFLVRLPRSLHARLARRAAAEGVSLNQFLTGVLAAQVGA